MFIFDSNYSINIPNTILNISVFSEILPVIFYLSYKKRIYDKGLQVIFFLILLSFISDLYGIYAILQQKGNFIFYNTFILIETLSLYYFFSTIIKSTFIKKIIFFLEAAFTFIWLWLLLKNGKNVYFTNCLNIENISVLALIIYYYYEQVIVLNNPSGFPARFWVVTAYFIYIAGTFFLFLYLPSLDTADQEKYYFINYLFTIIRTILLSIAMCINEKPPTPERKYVLT